MNTVELVEDFRWISTPSQASPTPWLALLAILAIVIILLVLWLKQKKKRAKRRSSPTRPPHEIALEELSRLRERMVPEEYMAFVIEVSRILREYVQARFGIRAPHRSTEEFLMEAAENPLIDEPHQTLLAKFLSQCDLVKFARRQVALDRMTNLIDTATNFVGESKETTPSATPEPLPA